MNGATDGPAWQRAVATINEEVDELYLKVGPIFTFGQRDDDDIHGGIHPLGSVQELTTSNSQSG